MLYFNSIIIFISIIICSIVAIINQKYLWGIIGSIFLGIFIGCTSGILGTAYGVIIAIIGTIWFCICQIQYHIMDALITLGVGLLATIISGLIFPHFIAFLISIVLMVFSFMLISHFFEKEI